MFFFDDLGGSNLRSRLGPPVKREHTEAPSPSQPAKVPKIDGAPVQNLVVLVRSNLQPVQTNPALSPRKGQPGQIRKPMPPRQPVGPQIRPRTPVTFFFIAHTSDYH